MLEYALRTERNKYLTSATQQHALNKEKDAAQQAQKIADEKDKERETKEGSETSKDGSRKDGSVNDEKEKPSALTNDKKRLMKEQTAAASGRASPSSAAPSDEATSATGGRFLACSFTYEVCDC